MSMQGPRYRQRRRQCWDAAGGRYVDVGGYVDVGKRGCRTSVVTVSSHYSSHLRDQGQSASILNTNGIYKNQAKIVVFTMTSMFK